MYEDRVKNKTANKELNTMANATKAQNIVSELKDLIIEHNTWTKEKIKEHSNILEKLMSAMVTLLLKDK